MGIRRYSVAPGRSVLLALAAGLMLWLASMERADALVATDSLGVGSTVEAECTTNVSTAVTFGNYDLNDPSALTVTATLTVTCSEGSIVYVMLGQGLYPAAGSTEDAPLRQMSAGGTERLRYDIFRDAAKTQIWGNTHASAVQMTGTLGAQSVTIHTTIPPLQGVMSGTYHDTVVVSVEY